MGFSKVLAGINAGTRAALSNGAWQQEPWQPSNDFIVSLISCTGLCPVDFALHYELVGDMYVSDGGIGSLGGE